MSDEEFFRGLMGGRNDFRLATEALRRAAVPFCLIGGLAVNHYTEPVVTLDADFAVSAAGGVAEALRQSGFEIEEFGHSLNARFPGSRLRLQITINSRYAGFPDKAVPGTIFGVDMPVASLENLVQGKLWAASDPGRRATKRQKDRLDLARLAEAHPGIIHLIPKGLVPEVDEMRLK